MKKQPLKSMMHGAFVLTIAAFIAKILSAVYRVPLQNLVGTKDFMFTNRSIRFMGLL